jgi:hypothetical protein
MGWPVPSGSRWFAHRFSLGERMNIDAHPSTLEFSAGKNCDRIPLSGTADFRSVPTRPPGASRRLIFFVSITAHAYY